MYDPELGRWFAPDPYGQNHSPYSAMGNNPANFVDPSGGVFGSPGLSLWEWFKGGVLGIGRLEGTFKAGNLVYRAPSGGFFSGAASAATISAMASGTMYGAAEAEDRYGKSAQGKQMDLHYNTREYRGQSEVNIKSKLQDVTPKSSQAEAFSPWTDGFGNEYMERADGSIDPASVYHHVGGLRLRGPNPRQPAVPSNMKQVFFGRTVVDFKTRWNYLDFWKMSNPSPLQYKGIFDAR